MEKEVSPIPTPITLADFVAAVETAWPSIEEEPCTRPSCSVVYAQYWIETGGKACYNWNIGNVKHVDRDGFDYYCLRGIWEGVPLAQAQRLVATGEASLDPVLSHNTAVGAGKVSVVFNPPHPQTRFRSYASLVDGMEEHLLFLQKRYATAWTYLLLGDYINVAYALKARGYFTADPSIYAAGMKPAYERAMAFDPSSPIDLISTAGLQEALERLGYGPGPADGVLGPRTLAALKRFQTMRGLKVDGVFGPITRAAIANAMAAHKPIRSV